MWIYEEVGLCKEASDRTKTVRRQRLEIIKEPVVKTTTETERDAKFDLLKPKA